MANITSADGVEMFPNLDGLPITGNHLETIPNMIGSSNVYQLEIADNSRTPHVQVGTSTNQARALDLFLVGSYLVNRFKEIYFLHAHCTYYITTTFSRKPYTILQPNQGLDKALAVVFS